MQNKRCPCDRHNLIEVSHGTVCKACLLWPDLCNCGPNSTFWGIMQPVLENLARQ